MNRCFKISLIVAALGISAASFANEADRRYIRSMVRFFYVAAPSSAAETGPEIVIDDVLNNRGTGDIYTNANLLKFRQIIKAMLGSAAVAGAGNQDRLQAVLAKTLRMTRKPIAVYFVNDLAGPLTSNAQTNRWGISLSGRRVWPAASAVMTNRETSPWGGNMAIGIWHLNNTAQFNTLTSVLGTMCHEMVHTQDLTDMRLHLFGSFFYGNDRAHYLDEATPDMATAFSEAIANFAEMHYDRTPLNNAVTWFTRNDYMMVEATSPTGFRMARSLVAEINRLNIRPSTTWTTVIDPGPPAQNTTYNLYPIRSLPPDIIALNENIMAMIFHFQSEAIGFDPVMRAIGRNIGRAAYRVSTSAWANTVADLCYAGFPSGVTELSQITTSGGPEHYMLPIALVDYFTGFRSTTQAQLHECLESFPTVSDFVRHYWTMGVKERVRASINASAPADRDVQQIRTALAGSTPLAEIVRMSTAQ